ncbi:peptidoglycan DD-metalloendopeptidase family protein [bacterium]|nr:peptidoglycan DD-metalloendopeptidase family protein [bacterium]
MNDQHISRFIILFFVSAVICVFLTPGMSHADEAYKPVGSGQHSSDVEPHLQDANYQFHLNDPIPYFSPKERRPAEEWNLFYEYPLEYLIDEGVVMVNYIDHDPSQAIVDYMGMPHSYDGHRGTDISLYNFKEMDRGVAVYAATSGVVASVHDGEYDRQIGWQDGAVGNHVILNHYDGTRTLYWHFRRNSITVEVGEEVERGQMLGLSGSSGYSSDAHLHLEVQDNINNVWTTRDPWRGTQNQVPTLWQQQLQYYGDDHLRLYDAGVTTETGVGGDRDNVPARMYKERFTSPTIFGQGEPILLLWLQMQGLAGDTYHISIRKPNNVEYGWVNYTLNGRFRYGWHWWYWNFAQNVDEGDFGFWRAEISINGDIVSTVPFWVGDETEYPPRFEAPAGRSFVVNGEVQRDTLRVDELSGPVTFSLLENDIVSIVNDSVLVIPPESPQELRSYYFRVLATGNGGYTDTAYYHLVDFGEEHPPPFNTAPDQVTLTIQPNYLNLISLPLNPVNWSVESIFGEIAGLEIVYENSGEIFIPEFVNSIEDIKLNQGYRVFTTEEAELTFHGYPHEANLIHMLSMNTWNWFGYPLPAPAPITELLDEISDQLLIVLNDQGDFWIPEMGLDILGNMEPGKGYLAMVSEDVSFVYPEIELARVAPETKRTTQPEGSPAPTGAPYIVLVNTDNLSEDIAMLSAYDGDLLVGKAYVQDGEITPLVTWQGAPENNLKGFISGNPIRLTGTTSTGKEFSLDHTQGAFGEGAYATLSIQHTSVPVEFSMSEPYPNPFNPSTSITISIPSRQKLTLRVYDLMGREVAVLYDGQVRAGTHKFTFNGNSLASGVYFIRADHANGQSLIRKAMLLK